MTIPQIEEEQKKTRAEFDLVKAAYEGKLTEMRENKDKGFKLAEQALRMNLTDPQAQRVIADYYRMNKKWKEAEDALEFVAKAKPRSAGLRFIRGMIAKDRDNDCKKAVELFQDALTVDDKFNKARFYLAVCTDELGDKEKAAGIMKMVLTQAANHPGAKAYLKYSDVLADAKRAAAEAAATQAEVGGAAAEGAKN
jgi:tetratricopeptide (TPR) repeat protein